MLKFLRRILVTAAAGALLCGTMVRFAPGYDSDERALDSQLSAESIAAIRAERETGIAAFYIGFLKGYLHGDLGTSRQLNQPVRTLIAERLRPTMTIVFSGLAMAWLAALAAVAGAAMFQKAGGAALNLLSAALVSLPVALMALLLLVAGRESADAAAIVVACAVFPRLVRYLQQILEAAKTLPHVLTAHARGIPAWRVFWRHVALCRRAELVALAGVSVSFALGAAIPAEVVLDVAGVGQLAWQAALGRDLPLLVNVTMLITLLVVTANAFSDWVGERQ